MKKNIKGFDNWINPEVKRVIEERKKLIEERKKEGGEKKKKVILSKVVPGDMRVLSGKYRLKSFCLRLPVELYQKLKEKSKESGISMSEIIRSAIWEKLKI